MKLPAVGGASGLGVGESPTSDQLKVKMIHNSYWKVILKIPQTGHLEVSQVIGLPPVIHLYIGFSIINHPCLGTPPFQETPHLTTPSNSTAEALPVVDLLAQTWKKPRRIFGRQVMMFLPSFYHYIV